MLWVNPKDGACKSQVSKDLGAGLLTSGRIVGIGCIGLVKAQASATSGALARGE